MRGQCWPILGKVWPNPADLRTKFVEFGRMWPRLADSGPTSADLGPNLADSRPILPILSDIDGCAPRICQQVNPIPRSTNWSVGADLAGVWPKIDQCWSTSVTIFLPSAKVGPTLGPKRPHLAGIWSMLVKFRQISTKFGRCWPNVC